MSLTPSAVRSIVTNTTLYSRVIEQHFLPIKFNIYYILVVQNSEPEQLLNYCSSKQTVILSSF